MAKLQQVIHRCLNIQDRDIRSRHLDEVLEVIMQSIRATQAQAEAKLQDLGISAEFIMQTEPGGITCLIAKFRTEEDQVMFLLS
jgi:hypothetical protein